MSDELNFEDELHRKAGDAFAWLDSEYKRGVLTDHVMHTALVALDLALLGLAPSEYTDWACQFRASLKRSTGVETTVLAQGQDVYVLKLDRAAGSVTVVSIKGGKQESRTKEFDEPMQAVVRLETTKVTLMSKGFTVV